MVQAKTGQEVKKYYEKRYKKEQVEAMRPYEAYVALLPCLDLKKGKKLLDVGCGTGYFLKAVEGKVEAYGIDFSKESTKIAKKIVKKAKVSQGRAENLKFKDRTFDYVACLGCLQYFPDMKKALSEMKRVARKKAVFLLMMPNANFLFWKFRGRDPNVLWGIEKNILAVGEWARFLGEAGLRVEAVRKDPWTTQRIKVFADKSPLAIIKRLLMKFGLFLLPSGFTYQHVFLCRRD